MKKKNNENQQNSQHKETDAHKRIDKQKMNSKEKINKFSNKIFKRKTKKKEIGTFSIDSKPSSKVLSFFIDDFS